MAGASAPAGGVAIADASTGGPAGGAPDSAAPAAQVSDPLALLKVKEEAEAGTPASVADASSPAVGISGDPLAPTPGPEDEELEELAQKKKRRERRRKRRGVPPVAYAFIAMAGGFGAVAAYVVFSSPPGETQASGAGGGAATASVAAQDASGTGGEAAKPAGTTVVLDPVQVEPGDHSLAAGDPDGNGAPESTGKPKSGDSSGDPLDTSGFNSDGPSGPSSGPSGQGSDQGRSELTTAEIQSVVNRYKGGVSRRCLPIVEGGSPSGATSARVVAHITVGSSGSVVSSSASGGGDFPGLASCVAARVRNWRFPASSGTTRVDVPFHFIAQ